MIDTAPAVVTTKQNAGMRVFWYLFLLSYPLPNPIFAEGSTMGYSEARLSSCARMAAPAQHLFAHHAAGECL